MCPLTMLTCVKVGISIHPAPPSGPTSCLLCWFSFSLCGISTGCWGVWCLSIMAAIVTVLIWSATTTSIYTVSGQRRSEMEQHTILRYQNSHNFLTYSPIIVSEFDNELSHLPIKTWFALRCSWAMAEAGYKPKNGMEKHGKELYAPTRKHCTVLSFLVRGY